MWFLNLFNHIVEVIHKRPIHAPQYTIPHPTFFLISTTPFSIFEVYTWLLCKLVVLVNSKHLPHHFSNHRKYFLWALSPPSKPSNAVQNIHSPRHHIWTFLLLCSNMQYCKNTLFLGCASVSAASRILSSILCHFCAVP